MHAPFIVFMAAWGALTLIFMDGNSDTCASVSIAQCDFQPASTRWAKQWGTSNNSHAAVHLSAMRHVEKLFLLRMAGEFCTAGITGEELPHKLQLITASIEQRSRMPWPTIPLKEGTGETFLRLT